MSDKLAAIKECLDRHFVARDHGRQRILECACGVRVCGLLLYEDRLAAHRKHVAGCIYALSLKCDGCNDTGLIDERCYCYCERGAALRPHTDKPSLGEPRQRNDGGLPKEPSEAAEYWRPSLTEQDCSWLARAVREIDAKDRAWREEVGSFGVSFALMANAYRIALAHPRAAYAIDGVPDTPQPDNAR